MERTGREYPPETVWEAQELYCVARLTFEKVAEETGVAASTLKRWAATYDWRGKREKLAQAEADLAADTILARSAMLKKLIKSKNAQDGFAVSALESLAMKQAEAARAQKLMSAAKQNELRPIRTKKEAVAALEQVAELKLNRLLQNPGELDTRDVAEIDKIFGMIEAMKPKTAPDKSESKQLDSKTLEAIREQVYGL